MPAKGKEKQKVLAFSIEDLQLSPDDDRYEQGAACVRTYWAQAVCLSTSQQEEMIQHMKSHDYYVAQPSSTSATSHKLYVNNMAGYDMFGEIMLSWPVYLILTSVYTKLPKKYMNSIRQKFKSSAIRDYTDEYFKMSNNDKNSQPTKAAAQRITQSVTIARSASASSTGSPSTQSVGTTTPSPLADTEADSDAGEEPSVSSPIQRQSNKRPRGNKFAELLCAAVKRPRQSSGNEKIGLQPITIEIESSSGTQPPSETAGKTPPLVEEHRQTLPSYQCQCAHNEELIKLFEDIELIKTTVIGMRTDLDQLVNTLRQVVSSLNSVMDRSAASR